MTSLRLLLLAVLLLCLPFLVQADLSAYDIQTACTKKDRFAANAINNFCSGRNIMVPSAYANAGKWSTVRNARVNIDGKSLSFPPIRGF